jgi:hypothetical protein
VERRFGDLVIASNLKSDLPVCFRPPHGSVLFTGMWNVTTKCQKNASFTRLSRLLQINVPKGMGNWEWGGYWHTAIAALPICKVGCIFCL